MTDILRHTDIAQAIEAVAPLSLQEEWDNSGFQVGNPDDTCTGAMLCVDVTQAVIDEAMASGCNLIVSHHPLIFRGVRQVLGRNRPERVIAAAIRAGITVYSSHTSIDNASPRGVSWHMARMLGLTDIHTLAPVGNDNNGAGLGATGRLPHSMTEAELVQHVKTTFGSPVARCSQPAGRRIDTLALCGGAGAEFLPQAIAAGAQAMLTSDTKLNLFLDHATDIFLVDIGHWESEACTKSIFFDIISENFPNFAACQSKTERNPIIYL